MDYWYRAENQAKGRAIAAKCNAALHESVINQMVPIFTDLETEVFYRMSGGTWLEYDTKTRNCSLLHGQTLPSSWLVSWRMLELVRHDPALGTTMDDATPEEEEEWAARWPIYVLTDAGRSHCEMRMKAVTWARFGDLNVWDGYVWRKINTEEVDEQNSQD